MDYTSLLNQLYGSSFGRAPDQAGMDYWTGMLNSGQVSADQLASIFAASPEGLQYAAQQSAAPTTTTGTAGQTQDYSGLLGNIYQQELGRAADQGGLDYWSNMLSTGQIGINDLSKIFSDTEEGRAYDAAQAGGAGSQMTNTTTGATTGTGTGGDYTDLLKEIYTKELGRAPDEAGMQYWSQQLASGAIKPEQLSAIFSGTPEGGIFDAYANELYRKPEVAGMEYWLGMANKGMSLADIQKAIGASPEARVQDAYHSILNRTGEEAGVKYWVDQYVKGNMTYAQLQAAIRAAGLEKKEPTVIGSDGKTTTTDQNSNTNNQDGNNTSTPITQRVFTPAEMAEYYSYGQRPEHRFYAPSTGSGS